MTNVQSKKVPLKKSFVRYNVAAVTATATDFLLLTFCTEVLNIYYVISTAIGATAGALVSFSLGRNWAFDNKDGGIFGQMSRFIITNLGSIVLNTIGVYLFTEVIASNHYLVSKIIVAILVGFGFNFPMQRYFVFRHKT